MKRFQLEIDLIKKSGLFDTEYYLKEYPDVAISGMDPVEHYLKYGALLLRRPSEKFDTKFYVGSNSDVTAAKINPLLHYVKFSMKEEKVETKKQVSTNSVSIPQPFQKNDKVYNAIASSPFFDNNWYKTQYYAYIKSDEDLISHYIKVGVQLGLDPCSQFSTRNYVDYYRDVKASGVNPLFHYIEYGQREGRKPKPAARENKLHLTRFTPEESGMPHSVLKYDALPQEVVGIEKESIAVHLHLFHVNMANEIIAYLINIQHSFTLLISIQLTDDPEHWEYYFTRHLPRATAVIVKAIPNRGRDIAPWVVDFREEIEKSTIFCHIHSKRSDHNKSHNGWFRYLSHTILGSESVVDQILDLFCSNRDVGAVGPCYFWTLASQPNYGKNRVECEKLYSRLSNNPLPDECPDYPAGSFFWIRTNVLKPLFDLQLTRDDFPEEKGQVDGTIAHAVERIVGMLPAFIGTNYHMVTVDVAYDLTRYIHPGRKHLSRAIQRPSESSRSHHILLRDRPKIAVFSCVSGGYEKPIPLITHRDEIDCFIFSDDENFSPPNGYEFKLSNFISHIPVRTARFVKTHPHVWFKDYDYACWIDSNVHFFGDIYKYLEILDQSGADCGFIPHPVRETVHEEFEVLAKGGIVNQSLAENQISRYIETPEVLKAQLTETNFFICRPKSERVVRFMRCWWSEINSYTHRDQLSVNYAIHQSGLKWVNLLEPGRSAREHPDFVLFRHDYKDRDQVIDFINNNGVSNVLV